MNLRVAASVAAGHGYGFRYGVFFPFPAQTDGPFVLPAAVVFRVFGIGFNSAQAVPVGYVLGFAAATAWLLRLGGCGRAATLAGLAAVLALPGMRDYATGGYGEIPSLCWLLLGLCCAMRGLRRGIAGSGGWWLGGAGLALGVAAITKVSAILAVAPVLAAVAVAALISRRSRGIGALIAGTVLPPLGWELFRLRALGGTGPWLDWWRLQLGQMGEQSGSAGVRWDPEAVTARVAAHAAVLEHAVGLGGPMLAALLLLPWLGVARVAVARGVAPERRMAAAAVAAASTCLFGWWLAVAPDNMTWPRRILPGMVLQVILVALLLPNPMRRWRMVAAGVPAAAILFMAAHGTGGPGLGEMLRRRDEVARVATAIRALPADAVLFGSGWWQAPVLTLFSGRDAENFERWDPARVAALRDAFFLSDRDGDEIGGAPDALLDDIASLRPVVRTPDAALWRMVAVDAAMPMRGGAEGAAFDAGRDGQAPGEGWYPSAGGWAWVRPDSTLLLRRTTQRALLLDAAFWSEVFPAGRALSLRVRAAGCLDRTVAVPGAGLRRIMLELDCAPATAAVPFALRIETDRSMPVPRQLDADTRERSFEIRRAALVDAG